MKVNSLPRQIVILVATVLFAVLLVLWVSLLSVQNAMNRDAAEDSRQRTAGRIATMQEQVSILASDYHNWTDLYLNAVRLEVGRLASNYGITANRGDVFQYAELFDGPFENPLSWSAGQGLSPQKGILSLGTKEALRLAVPALDNKKRQTFDYFEMRDGHLVMFSASYLLPEDEDLLAQVVAENAAIAAIGKVLNKERLAEVAREFFFTELVVAEEQALGTAVTIPLLGVTGKPVAWLQWSPPKPGTLLFWKMFPIMVAVSLTFFLIFYSAARLLRIKAEALISQEAISFENARTDALTGLPNRFALREHLARLSERTDLTCAVLAIDLVRFKQINDTVGHLGGDVFLLEVSRRLSELADDTTFVSRYGGDEFFIVMIDGKNLEALVARKCRQLSKIFDLPIRCNGVLFEATASKGLALQEGTIVDHEELLRRADRAMYSAKALRTQDVIRYDTKMKLEDLDQKRIEAELRRAVADGRDFKMHYQPIVMARGDARVARYEALARWESPKLGQVSPEKFIQVAEESGLIVPLGWHLVDLVCSDMQELGSAQVNINVSPTQLMTPGFAKTFADRVAAHGITADRINIEVTEQIAVRDDVAIARELFALSDFGFTLALDDFGTGFSSIGYLTKMPFTVLKIDRSFVSAVNETEHSSLMIRSMISLAHAMKMQVVVEGIETTEMAERLRAIGVDYFQGYYFGRPVPAGVASETGAVFSAKYAS